MPPALRHPACACRQRRLRGTGNPSWIISPTKFSAAPVLWGSWSFAVSEMCVRRGGERARATGSWSGVARSRRCILTGRVGAPFAWSMRRQNPPAASTCPRPAAFLGPAANGRKLEVARAPSPDARYGILPPLARCPMRGSGLPVPHRRTLAAASCRRSLDAGCASASCLRLPATPAPGHGQPLAADGRLQPAGSRAAHRPKNAAERLRTCQRPTYPSSEWQIAGGRQVAGQGPAKAGGSGPPEG